LLQIEVAVQADTDGSNKKKGDLLEEFAGEFAATQGFDFIVREVRTASSEIDLECTNSSTGERTYIECKAHRKPLSKLVLSNIVGVVYGEDFTQGWLLSTGPLGKDAKGYKANWAGKPQPERARLRVSADAEFAEKLIAAKLVKDPRGLEHPETVKHGYAEATWILLITEFGRFWIAPKFDGGMASEVIVFGASDLLPIQDEKLLSNLSKVDSSWRGTPFAALSNDAAVDLTIISNSLLPVVEVLEGQKWSDYYPARLQDFSGRTKEMTQIAELLEAARNGKSTHYVFAITGDSGIGKSSLITSVRGRSRSRQYKQKHFVIAVDCRAAKSRDYINAALLRGLRKAQQAGFGDSSLVEMVVTNPSHPLASPSISDFIESLRQKNQVFCIIFDQFEEIYSKQELKDVFTSAQDLFLSAISTEGPFVVGFAWRKNISIQQEHPAYHTWHKLAQYRREFPLKTLEHSEVNSALTTFEKELGWPIRKETRRQIHEAARGYPWLLKKLCTHLLKRETAQSNDPLAAEDFSVESLFTEDLQGLSGAERRLLQFVAENAPVAAFEVAEMFGKPSLKSLEDRLLVTRSGEMLNVYWDIFRDFLLTDEVPELPFSFIPFAPSIGALLSVADGLSHEEDATHSELASRTNLAVSTVGNVVRDLLVLGVAVGSYSQPRLSSGLEPSDPKGVVRKMRDVISKHTLLRALRYKNKTGTFSAEEIEQALIGIQSIPGYSGNTLRGHARRLCAWFAAAGFFHATRAGWKLVDLGDVDLSYSQKIGRRRTGPFNGGSTPKRSLEALAIIRSGKSVDQSELQSAGFTKALDTLSRFGLIVKLEHAWNYVAEEGNEVGLLPHERLLRAAEKQDSIMASIDYLNRNPTTTGTQIAEYLATKFDEDWSKGSLMRTGNGLRRWAEWVIACEDAGAAIEPSEGVRGNKSKKTPDAVKNIRDRLAGKQTKKGIAKEMGISTMTLNRWLEEDPA
jgi:hypothetical protein